MTTEEYKQQVIDASKIAVEELIKVLKEPIISDTEEDLSADRLKNAVAAKKMASFDALEILSRIDEEQLSLSGEGNGQSKGFAEKNAK